MKLSYCKLWILVTLCFATLSACYSERRLEYYSQRENYIHVSGIISHINYNSEADALYLAITDINPILDDNNFKIVGNNFKIVRDLEIENKIEIGTYVELITAPKYWGDGYVMPIVSISINGETLLEFEEGYSNWIKWLNKT